MYRALLESVAYEYAGYLEAARRLDPATEPAEVRVIGGGAASRLWTQIKADVLGVPFSVMEDSNYTCWGAALSAGVGVGVVDDLAAAARAAARVRSRDRARPGLGGDVRRARRRVPGPVPQRSTVPSARSGSGVRRRASGPGSERRSARSAPSSSPARFRCGTNVPRM